MRHYSNPHGQQFIRTSETHGLLGEVPVEFETPEELLEWLWDSDFYTTEIEEVA